MNRFVASTGEWPSQPPRTTTANLERAVGMTKDSGEHARDRR